MKKIGIDTSRWQGDFDFAKARDTEGIEYAIIKCGGADNGLYTDRQFENSYNKLAGIDMHKGTYFYGNAFSEDEARNEARYCASILAGKSFCYPIFYDVEGAMLTGNDLTDIVMAFMDEMREAGFAKIGLYSSESHINNYIDVNRVKDSGYYLWVARYSDTAPNIGVDYDLWQFGGGINYIRDTAINGQTVDQDYCYTDFCDEHTVETPSVPDYEPVPDTKYHQGDTVVVINAVQYDNGQPFSTWYDEYNVISVSGRRVVIGIGSTITAAIDEDNIRMADSENIEVDTSNTAHATTSNKVRVLDNLTYDGQRFGVYYDEYDVIQADGDRVVIGIGDVITAAVNIANLEFIGGNSEDVSQETQEEAPTGLGKDMQVRFTGTTDSNGTPLLYTDRIYTLGDIEGETCLLYYDGGLYARVNTSEVERA